jgi:hypothetical protein
LFFRILHQKKIKKRSKNCTKDSQYIVCRNFLDMAEINEENPAENQDLAAQETESGESESSLAQDRAESFGMGKNREPLPRVTPLMYDDIYLKTRLEDQMNWYDRKSSWNQKAYKKFKRLEFTIAASIPVLISFSTMSFVQGLSVKFGPNDMYTFGLEAVMQISAAVGGVILVILNKQLELEEYYKLWKDYRSTAEALQQERVKYLTRTEPYDEEDAFPLLVEKVESILNNETQKWKLAKPPQSQKAQAAQPQPVAKPAVSQPLPDEDIM